MYILNSTGYRTNATVFMAICSSISTRRFLIKQPYEAWHRPGPVTAVYFWKVVHETFLTVHYLWNEVMETLFPRVTSNFNVFEFCEQIFAFVQWNHGIFLHGVAYDVSLTWVAQYMAPTWRLANIITDTRYTCSHKLCETSSRQKRLGINVLRLPRCNSCQVYN